jgi:carbon monoxide dehydrogenase subunit G
MEMQGSRVLAVTQQQAWDALLDPQVLQACIPGCEKMEATGDNQYTAALAVRVGPVSARFNGKVALSDVVAPQSCTIGFDGQGGAAGFGKGQAKVRLTPQDGGKCELAYDVNAQVGGKIAQVGQRLIDGVAKSMAEDFFQRFDAEMGKRYPPPGGAVPAAVAPAPAGPGAKMRQGCAWLVAGLIFGAIVAWFLKYA